MLFKNLSIGKYFFYCLLIATIIKVQSQTVYSVELNTFEISKNYDTTWIDWNTIRMKQVSRNKFVITGDFSVNRNLGKEQQVSLMIFNYDAEHKKKGMLVYFLEKNVCTFLKDEYDMYTQLLEVSNLPPTDSCPFPKVRLKYFRT
uniref:Uncharacterized protein n=1 Tax=Glossina brevipalpis TaxID=37001 RepID=A0A1A9WCP3_9MUSC